MKVITSAPGKLMLFGEHAVVYERPCIVTAVGIRVRVEISKVDSEKITVQSSVGSTNHTIAITDLLGTTQFPKEVSFVLSAIKVVFSKYNIASGLLISTYGPENSYGLGSSSAVTVATIANLDELFKLKLSLSEMFQLSYQAVLAVQGKASGFDVAAAVYGGTLFFTTGGMQITPLEIPTLPVVIGYSGKKVGTVNLINAVEKRQQDYPRIVNSIFDTIAKITEEARLSLLNDDWETVGILADINQGLLDSLGVSSLSLAKLIFASRSAEALGAKLSGAGGGDCMFAIAPNTRKTEVQNAIERAGGEVIDIQLNAPGVRVEGDEA
jgi:mevalonate kinase